VSLVIHHLFPGFYQGSF